MNLAGVRGILSRLLPTTRLLVWRRDDPMLSPRSSRVTAADERLRRRARRFTALLGILSSSVFLYLAVYKVDLREVRLTLASVNLVWLIPMIAISLIGFWLRAVRWA